MKDFRIPKTEAHVFYVLQGKDRKCFASDRLIRMAIDMFYKDAENNPVVSYLELNEPEYFLDNLNRHSVLIVLMPSATEGNEGKWWPAVVDEQFTGRFVDFLKSGSWTSTHEAAMQFVAEHEAELMEAINTDGNREKRKIVNRL